jgi:hypothetical protein
MPTNMTKEEREAFLSDVHICVLSINDPGKGPLTVPMWYNYEVGGDVWFMMQRESKKGRLLDIGARVSVCVQNETAPYRYVTVEGPVTAIEPYTVDRDILPMAKRYLGEKGGQAYAEQIRAGGSEGGGIKVVVHPERWLTVDYNKGQDGARPVAED